MRVTSGSAWLPEGAYLRVHTEHRTFPAAGRVDWRSRVLYDGPHFVVADKPAGVQAVATVDNTAECVTACVAAALGIETPLRAAHRLDEGTSGVLVLAKSSAAAARFQRLMTDRSKVKKHYRCATVAQPPLGVMEHYVLQGERFRGSPKATVPVPQGTLQAAHCKLEVQSVAPVQLAAGCAGSDGCSYAYESVILLHTGRAHQIRSQLAAVGCPLVGDALYTYLSANDPRFGCSIASSDNVHEKSRDRRYERCESSERIDWKAVLGAQGCSSIALQACKLEVFDPEEGKNWFGSESVSFESRWPPRWRGDAHNVNAVMEPAVLANTQIADRV